jgi:HSP20 family protein
MRLDPLTLRAARPGTAGEETDRPEEVDHMTLVFDPFAPLFPRLDGTAAFTAPADVTVGESDLMLTMDLPGLTAEDLDIELLDGYLSVRGERRRPEVGEGKSFVHTERPFGRFERRIKLPDGVDAESIMARMDNGVLSLIVPKPERLKPRSIAIGTSSEQPELETATA